MKKSDQRVDYTDEGRNKQAKKGNKMSKSIAAQPTLDHEAEIAAACRLARERFARIGVELAAQVEAMAPTTCSNARSERCLKELRMLLAGLGPEWDAVPFGSFANGFNTVNSDLDVVCCSELEMAEHPSLFLGNKLLPLLKEHASFAIEAEVLGARVPILKLVFEGELSVDVSCHNPQVLRNTGLLAAYARIDPRVQLLGVAVKLWAKGAGVCDATKSNLSSYAFILLTLYFLQVHPAVQLPALPIESFQSGGTADPDKLVKEAKAAWTCELSLVELLALFFEFYTRDFAWGSEVASVRLDSRCVACDPAFFKLRGRHAIRLHIEDPFQVERNLHCVLGEVEEVQLWEAFGVASQMVIAGSSPIVLPLHGCVECPLADSAKLIPSDSEGSTESGTSTRSGGSDEE